MLLYILLLCISCTLSQDNGPVVDTQYGEIRGSSNTDQQGRVYEEYLGVPFAAPPVGSLRWEKPQSPDSWEGVRDTVEFSPQCTQIINSNETSEDCLYLNIYVPGENRVGSDLSVFVWIHGGAFIFGAGESHLGYDLALHGDVILVNINYRLSSIGWLSTEDEVAPGNYGLWDVQAALLWVRDNIAAFGGDPESITVSGQSAGGALTSHVMISSQTNQLFHRGISVSGTSSGYFGVAIPGAVADTTMVLSRLMGCHNLSTSEERIDCLRDKEATALDYWGLVAAAVIKQQLPNWVPVIDGDFIPQHPLDSWKEGAASHLDLIIGNTYQDSAGLILGNILGEPNATFNAAGTPERLNISLEYLTNQYPGDTEEMIEAMFTMYPDIGEIDDENRTRAVITMTTDWWFQTWAHYEASQHYRTTDRGTYLYNFRYDQSFLQYRYDWIEGSHVDDIYSIFGYPYNEDFRKEVLGADFTEEDYLTNDYVASYYVNFINNGNPNIGLSVPVEWPMFDNDTKNYMEFSNTPQVLEETEEMREIYQFWNKEFPVIEFPPDLSPEYQVESPSDISKEGRVTWSDIEFMDEEEFEIAVDEAADHVKLWLIEQIPSESIEDVLTFIDTVTEERRLSL